MWSENITKRFDPRWPVNYMVGPGWVPLVEELNKQLSSICPDYKITQIKEKFGGLRFYTNEVPNEAWDIIEQFEEKSYSICDECGETGKLRKKGGWLRTICDKCEKEME